MLTTPAAVADLRNETSAFARLSEVELAGLEPATSWVRCMGKRAGPCASVRRRRTVEPNLAPRTARRATRANAERCHCCHAPTHRTRSTDASKASRTLRRFRSACGCTNTIPLHIAPFSRRERVVHLHALASSSKHREPMARHDQLEVPVELAAAAPTSSGVGDVGCLHGDSVAPGGQSIDSTARHSPCA
jgi:hypothetical protein